MKKIKTKRGREITLLNPHEKGTKYFDELTNDVRLTNDQSIKFDKFGQPTRLTKTEKAWRSGYLAAQRDSRKCYNATKDKHGR